MKNRNNSQKTDINEGSIVFEVNVGKINYSNGEIVPLFQISPQGGSIFILKDADKKIKFFHVYLGKDRTDVEYDVSKLDQNKKHMFAFTWSIKTKEIKIYIDGELKSTARISY